MAVKVLIVTGDAAESLEVLYPYQRLLEEGYEVHIAAPARKVLRFVVHDFEEGFDTYTEKPGYTWPADLAFAEVDPAQYAALVLPGGRAPEYLRNDPEVRRIVTAFTAADKPVAQICHGPLISAAAGALTGRRVTAYPALEPDMATAGAAFEDTGAVVDGTLVSSRAWPDHPVWMREFLTVLRGKAPLA
ncbi:DJ-1/PfpI family protein [Streptomyces sp. NPDC089919]|uniref:DJ-1/PfpI family protein n=1 Tax=Streptomyces sp. NPDC089919 TaxID=3155188 RepID=UPI003433A82F